ncbi:murein hydrolase activator EnvC family protein [Bacillus sp. OTU530]|uniref:murein hydrolase activator EnvC family protein n=1 Tax=Bacillus sp. OTU530 TaxID=3043862 RepID=UPI00313B1B8D
MKKHTVLSMLATGAFLLAPTASIYAETNQDKLNSIESQLNGTSQQLDNHKQEKLQIEQDIALLQQKLDELNTAIANTEQELATIEQQIKETEAVIEEKNRRIGYLQVQIEKRQVLIDQRLRTLQEQPRSTLVTELIINSKNITDLLEKMYSVSLILNSDNDILQEQARDKDAVETEQKAVKEQEAALQQQKEMQVQKQQQQAADKQQQEVLMNDMHAKLSQTMEEIESTEETKALLEAQRQATQQLVEADKRAAAQAAAQAAQAAAAQAQAAEDAKKAAAPSAGASSQPSVAAVNQGGFIKPAAGAFTSGFGGRWGKLHAGVDIAASGTVPVVAAADGVVIRAYASSSYGNVVFISHRINGQTYTTVYAHLSSYSVGTGQTVKQGQQIGIMGNTGDSQGQHLHFELHVGEWNLAKSNAVNPMPYL